MTGKKRTIVMLIIASNVSSLLHCTSAEITDKEKKKRRFIIREREEVARNVEEEERKEKIGEQIKSKFLEPIGAIYVYEQVNDGLKKAGDFIADRFRDTKATRFFDYHARLAALTVSKELASGILKASEGLSQGTLELSKQTALAGFKAADVFVNQVGKNVADVTLKGSAEAAKGILEGAKQTSLGVLKGTQWVVDNTLGQIDVTCIHYDGNLQDLAKLNLGNVTIKGKIIKEFTLENQELNLSNPISSIESFAKNIGKMMENAFIKPQTAKIAQQAKMPLEQALQKVDEGFTKAILEEKQLTALQTPQVVVQAALATQKAEKEIAQEQKKTESLKKQADQKIVAAAIEGYDGLLKYVDEHGSPTDQQIILYKQELQKKREELSKTLGQSQ